MFSSRSNIVNSGKSTILVGIIFNLHWRTRSSPNNYNIAISTTTQDIYIIYQTEEREKRRKRMNNILRLGKSVSNFFTCLATSLLFIFVPYISRSVEDPFIFPSSIRDEGPFPILNDVYYTSLLILYCVSSQYKRKLQKKKHQTLQEILRE